MQYNTCCFFITDERRAIFRAPFCTFSIDNVGQVADNCECGDEPSGSVKCGEFLE